MFIKNFTELGKNDAGIAGGKGASLGEMTSAGIPVPPGFVVLSEAFEQFLKETDLAVEIDTILHTVDTQAMHTVEHASERIQKLILEAKMPEDIARDIESNFRRLDVSFVAVRSSATAEDSASAAWAGQLDSFLNTTEESLLGNVKRCWASLFTPRAIFYRFEQGLHDTHISVAVVVQKMIESEVSGIAFSVHPVTEDRNQLIIEAGYGLGEAIVSGQITPDSYVVEKAPRRIIDKNIAKQERGIYRAVQTANEWRGIEAPKQEQQKLSDEQILELSGTIITIENHYGFPCDIEWAYESGKFYIVQSRPITTLAALSANEWEFSELLNFDPAEYEFHGRWKSNIFTCYFWTYVWHDGLAKELALPVSENGYFVMNEGSVFIKKKVADALRATIEDALREHDELFFSRMKAIIDREFPGQMEQGRSLAAAEPTPETFREFLKVSEPLMFLWYFGYLLSYSFEKVLQERAVGAGIDPSEVSRYVPIMETPLLKRQKELSQLKALLTDKAPNEPEVEAQLREHLKEYGWIEIMNFIGEELTLEKLLDQVDHFEEPVTERSELQKTSAAMEEMFTGAAYVTYLRQVGAEYFSAYILATRPFLNRTAQALGLVSYRDLLMLTPDEIIGFLGEGGTEHPKEKVAERTSGKWAIWSASNREVHVVDSPQDIERLEGKLLQKSTSSTDGIRGQIGNKGRAQGKVKIVLNSDEFGKLEEGDVLVTTMTTPDFVPLMQKAAAIVTEIGGMLSHAAIVSRELGKPCVIGTKIATQVLHDGDLVEVDANEGVVRIMEKAETVRILTNVFSREKSLYYFDLWNQCDREGAEMFFGHRYEPVLFIILPKGKKGSVWYSAQNMELVSSAALELLTGPNGEELFQKMKSEIDRAWSALEIYAKGKKIENINELKIYQRELLRYWQTMNSALWAIIDDARLPEHMKGYFIGIREKTEQYSERWSILPTEFFASRFPQYADIVFTITFDEMMRLAGGTISDSELDTLRARTNGCFLIGETVYSLAILDTFLVEHHLQFELVTDKNLKEFSGTTAFAGRVRGIVKIVDGSQDMDKITEGDILVTQMTNPKYVPAIKLASAVITDEGGTLCHAAIVARELKKPCIIGTKIATQVLKDGDLVEVDANTGVVRIVSR